VLVDLRPRAQLALKFVHVADDAYDPRSLALLLTNLDLVPMASPRGKKRLANSTLTTATIGAVTVSESKKPRLLINGICMVRKYPDPTAK
jgi:hypothetical protein